MQSIDQRWQPIEVLSESMMAHAKAGEWEALATLEQQRRALIESFFATPVGPAEAPKVAQYIESLLAQDKVMMSLGTTATEQVQGEINTFSTGRKAKQAYAKHT